jgi:alpha-1,2-mannosyltransferase
MLTSILVVLSSIVLGLLISLLLAPRIVRAIGGAVGIYLHHKTAGRRAHILERVVSEGKKKDSDEEWENVDALAAGTAGNGQPADREWEGIVGFFHPFWYGIFPG